MMKVAVVIGSLRKDAFSRKVANALRELAPPSLKQGIVEIRYLSLYNPDLDEQPPRAWQEFREAIRGADAVIFVTPEYNRSIPGALKNALTES
jgi:chromate reductase